MIKICSTINNNPQIIEENYPTQETEDIFRIKLLCCQCLEGEDYDSKTKTSLKRCLNCKSVWYCNKECQSLAWKTHKVACQAPSEKQDRGLYLNQWKMLSGISTYYDEKEKFQSPIKHIPNDEEIVCKFQNVDGKLRELTQKEFKEITGMVFTKGALYSQKALIKMHESGEIQPSGQSLKLFDSVALAKDESMGFELIAIDHIPKGAIVACFGGEVFDNDEFDLLRFSKKIRSYGLSSKKDTCHYDPSKYAGLGAFINDGPPNCRFMSESRPSDKLNSWQSNEVFVIALRDINPKERIYVDYGKHHDIKADSYILSEGAFENIVNMSEKSYQPEMIDYILNTPHVLALLFLRDIFDKNPIFFQCIKDKMDAKILNGSILSALALIPKHERKAYAEKLSTFSQRSFKIICAYIQLKQEKVSAEQWQMMGQILDEMFVLLFGTSCGNYWLGSERWEFEKQFLSPEHQSKLIDFGEGKFDKFFDEDMVKSLPRSFLNLTYELSGDLLNKILVNYLIHT